MKTAHALWPTALQLAACVDHSESHGDCRDEERSCIEPARFEATSELTNASFLEYSCSTELTLGIPSCSARLTGKDVTT